MKVSRAYRLLRNEIGGSLLVGFSERDTYNSVANEVKRTLDGSDVNYLMCVLENRCVNKQNIFYKFKLADDDCLMSFFWRDSGMKSNYLFFVNLLVFDTTHRTNRYEMKSATFVYMSHHVKNGMVGCGFLINEKVKSFVWLFKTFLKTIDNVHPKTMIADQSLLWKMPLIRFSLWQNLGSVLGIL